MVPIQVITILLIDAVYYISVAYLFYNWKLKINLNDLKYTFCILLKNLVESKIWYESTYLWNRLIEQACGDQRGGGVEKGWKFGISRCKLLCTGWINSKVPLPMEFSRQEYWSGVPFPTPGVLPNWICNTSISCIGRWIT